MNSGSLLSARLNLNPVAVLTIVLILAVFIGLLYGLSKLLQTYFESSVYSEKNKNKPTTKHHINQIAKKLNCDKKEYELLKEIFTSHPLPNIIFAIKSYEYFEPYFKEKFIEMESKNTDEQTKFSLFSLRSKIFSTFQITNKIKNTKMIPVNSILTFTPSRGIHYQLKLVDSTINELFLELPPNFHESDKPEELSKIKLVFIYTDFSSYSFETRVIRFQKGKNNSTILVCTHTDKLISLQRRSFSRIELNVKCRFSSVKVQNNKNNADYIINEKVHEGILADSSAGGCRILTNLPIKAEQYIFIDGALDGKNDYKAIGKILRTTKNKKDEYILHIKFVKIDVSIINKINAVACNYKV